MEKTTPHPDASQRVSLADEEKVKDLLVGTVFGLWDIVNNLTRLQPSKRQFYRVSIFGSARAESESPVYQEVKRLAAALTTLGCDIITGGGPGLMRAANEGAQEANIEGKQHSMGIRITLPFEQKTNEYVAQSYEHLTFFSRLHHFVLASDAFIVVPGGIGTALETLMVWQLIQVKHLEPMPLILIGEMYEEFVQWAKHHMTNGPQKLAHPQDMEIPRCVKNIDDAVALIRDHKVSWIEKRTHAEMKKEGSENLL